MPSALALPLAPSEPEVMEIEGRLDDATAPKMEGDAMLCIQSGARRLVLDCGRVAYISAAGLRAVLALAREMKSVEGRLAVCGLQPQVKEMFDACGFDAIVPVYANQNEAVEATAGC